jgi:hypothetical protein
VTAGLAIISYGWRGDMTRALIVCATCSKVNRATLPLPEGKEIRCGSCRAALRFPALSQTCPECKRGDWRDGDPAECKTCGLLAGHFPLLSFQPPRTAAPERPLWINRVVRPSVNATFETALEEFRRAGQVRQEAFAKAQRVHADLLAKWKATALEMLARKKAGAIEAAARAEWSMVYSKFKISELSGFTGSEFERFLAALFCDDGL